MIMLGPLRSLRTLLNDLISLPGEVRGARAEIRSLRETLSTQSRLLDRIELLARGGGTYLGDNRVLLPVEVGNAQIAYLLEADDRLFTPWFITSGRYENTLTNYFLANLRPTDHCIDAGTNFGYFTCLFARFCPQGRVIGIEPEPRIRELARDNVLVNGFGGRAEVIQAAVSDNDTGLTLYRRHTRSGNTGIIQVGEAHTSRLGERPAEPFQVATMTIDQIAQRLGGRVDIIKIDVEGAEPLALAGARETLRANPALKIIMEWSPDQIRSAGFDVAEFVAELERSGLTACDLDEAGTATPIAYPDLLEHGYKTGILLQQTGR